MGEKETICQIRLVTSGLCEVEFSVEIGCREVAVTKCPAPYLWKAAKLAGKKINSSARRQFENFCLAGLFYG